MINPRRRRPRLFAHEDDGNDDDSLPTNPMLQRVRMGSRRSLTFKYGAADDDDDDDGDDQESALKRIMKDTLDAGSLDIKSRDKEFYIFLDLKTRYHKSFLDKLRDHTLQGIYPVDALPFDEEEQRICAMDFLDKYGVAYWGTPENREKYLEVHKLTETSELATYPECKEE